MSILSGLGPDFGSLGHVAGAIFVLRLMFSQEDAQKGLKGFGSLGSP